MWACLHFAAEQNRSLRPPLVLGNVGQAVRRPPHRWVGTDGRDTPAPSPDLASGAPPSPRPQLHAAVQGLWALRLVKCWSSLGKEFRSTGTPLGFREPASRGVIPVTQELWGRPDIFHKPDVKVGRPSNKTGASSETGMCGETSPVQTSIRSGGLLLSSLPTQTGVRGQMQSIQRQEVKSSLKHGSWEDWVAEGGPGPGGHPTAAAQGGLA